jgi:tRNA dimethylallyltransferase
VTVRHLALVGPTATGKSALALAAARALGDVEIVTVDSMQVYRGLDVGTAKPTPEERRSVPHHVVDVADPDDDYSVARYQRAARAAVEGVAARGHRALLVGGTGLYFRALVDPLCLPPEDRAVREEILDAIEVDGVGSAYADLRAVDPVAAARIEPGNRRRIARALEVIRLTGRPFSSFGGGFAGHGPTVFPVAVAGVWLPRAVVSERIARRFATMRETGLVEEVRGLADAGPLSRTARQAIGYKEVLDHLEGREPSLDAALEQAERRTRALARRQRMWFRRDPRITWFASPGNPASLLPSLLAFWAGCTP